MSRRIQPPSKPGSLARSNDFATATSHLSTKSKERPCSLLFFLFLFLLFPGCTKPTSDKYPNRLIELIVPWAAGGGTDRVARFIAQELQQRLGQPVVVVNRTGGSGAVGHSAGALAPADGYTLTMGTFELSTMKAMGISELTWRDFQPVAQVNGDAAAIFVSKNAPWKTLPELLDAIRTQPKKLKMSGTATGGAWDLARSGLLLSAGISPSDVIWAPTQGSAPALVELMGGHVDVVCCSVPEAASQLESGQIRLLAVLGAKRLDEYSSHPTAREQGIDYEAVGWRGIMLPQKTPPAVVSRVSEALLAIGNSDAFKKFMAKNGFAIDLKPPADFAIFLDAQEAKWSGVIKSAGYETLGKNHDPGPRTVPFVLGTLLLLALAGEAIAAARRKTALSPPPADAPLQPGATRSGAFLLITLIVYLLLMPRIGFLASTILFAGVLMWKLGTRWWAAALSSVLLVSAIHVLFVMVFKVQLP